MKKRKLILAAAAVVLVAVAAAGATLAYFTDREEASNVVTMGNVNIKLEETGEKEREDGSVGIDYTDIVPNQQIEKDPTVSIEEGSADAYVRMKLKLSGDLTETMYAQLFASILEEVDNEVWYTDGIADTEGYYIFYCNTVFSTETAGDKVPALALFETFKIPEDWGNEIADKSFSIELTAEAIQADNFTPEGTQNADGTYKVITGWYNSAGEEITVQNYEG